MKIGFFTNTYLPNVFGLTTSIESFRKGLEELGHTVYVFAPRFFGYKDDNQNVFRYPALFWKYKIQYSIPLSYYPPINKIIDKLGLDIIHVHQPFSVAKDGLRQARRLGIPVVYTHHTRYEDYVHYVPLVPAKFLRWHVKNAATRFANKCDQVITPSEEIKCMIIERGVEKPIEVLPTGIDWERYCAGNRKSVREKFNIKDEDFCLLWTGRMETEKNVRFFVQVAKEIVRSHENVKVLLVGEGSEKAALEKMVAEEGIQEKILFAGLVKPEEMHHFYSAGDIFVQTSLTETQGLTTTEALATGLAVVAILATGAVDQIVSGENGILVENDKNELFQAIENLITDNDKRKQLGRAAREMAKCMDYKEKARELVEIYEKLISTH